MDPKTLIEKLENLAKELKAEEIQIDTHIYTDLTVIGGKPRISFVLEGKVDY